MGGLKHFIYKNTLDNHPKFLFVDIYTIAIFNPPNWDY